MTYILSVNKITLVNNCEKIHSMEERSIMPALWMDWPDPVWHLARHSDLVSTHRENSDRSDSDHVASLLDWIHGKLWPTLDTKPSGKDLNRFLVANDDPWSGINKDAKKHPWLTPRFEERLIRYNGQIDNAITVQKNQLLSLHVAEDPEDPDEAQGGIRLLQENNFIDWMTWLFNREAFSELNDLIKVSSEVSAVMFDFDHFKAFDSVFWPMFWDFAIKVYWHELGKIMLTHPEISIIRMWWDEYFWFWPISDAKIKQVFEQAFKSAQMIINDFLTKKDKRHIINWLDSNRWITDQEKILSEIWWCPAVRATFDTSLLNHDPDAAKKIYLFLDSLMVTQKHREEKEVPVFKTCWKPMSIIVWGRGKYLPPIAKKTVKSWSRLWVRYELLWPQDTSTRILNFVSESKLSAKQKKVFHDEKVRLDSIVQHQFNQNIPWCKWLLSRFDLYSTTNSNLRDAYLDGDFFPKLELDNLNRLLVIDGIKPLSLSEFEMWKRNYLHFKKISEKIWRFFWSKSFNSKTVTTLCSEINKNLGSWDDIMTKHLLIDLKKQYMKAKQEVYYYSWASSPVKLQKAISSPESWFCKDNVYLIDIWLFKSANELAWHIAGDTFITLVFQDVVLASLEEAWIPRDKIVITQKWPIFSCVIHDDFLHLGRDFSFLLKWNYRMKIADLNERMWSELEEIDMAVKHIDKKLSWWKSTLLTLALWSYWNIIDSNDPDKIIQLLSWMKDGTNDLFIDEVIWKVRWVREIIINLEMLTKVEKNTLMAKHWIEEVMDLPERKTPNRREAPDVGRNSIDRRFRCAVGSFQEQRMNYVRSHDKLSNPEQVWNLSVLDINKNPLHFN